MRTLIYSIAVSLDGYINDPTGALSWIPVDEEYHRFANAQQAETSLSIYGTRMWETMRYWNAAERDPERTDFMLEFARLSGLKMEGRPSKSQATGDAYCEWEYDLEETPETLSWMQSLPEV